MQYIPSQSFGMFSLKIPLTLTINSITNIPKPIELKIRRIGFKTLKKFSNEIHINPKEIMTDTIIFLFIDIYSFHSTLKINSQISFGKLKR